MRFVRITVPNGVLIGNQWVKDGQVVPVDTDHRAAELVKLKHAEFATQGEREAHDDGDDDDEPIVEAATFKPHGRRATARPVPGKPAPDA